MTAPAVTQYDGIVVGGGIAGLLSALRMALAGMRVVVLERSSLGAGASTSNHGIIHSGTLYARHHPDLSIMCQESILLFRRYFANAVSCSEPTWYVGTPDAAKEQARAWEAVGIPYSWVPLEATFDILRRDILSGSAVLEAQDLIVVPGTILQHVASACLSAGVTIMTDAPITGVIIEAGIARGVILGFTRLYAPVTLLCAGVGLREILTGLKFQSATRLRTRVDFMLAMSLGPAALRRPIFALSFGELTVAPTSDEVALISLFGAHQPSVAGRGPWPVDLMKAGLAIDKARTAFQNGVLDYSRPVSAYSCAKIEVAQGHADAWGVEPYPALLNHAAEDGVAGIWSLVPGKFTLGFHASATAVSSVLGQAIGLEIPELELDMLLPSPPVETSPWSRVDHRGAREGR